MKTGPAAPARREFLSIQDAADLLGVHHQTLRKAIRSGDLRASRSFRGRILIRRADLDVFIESGATA